MSLTKNNLRNLIAAGGDSQSNRYDVYYTFSDRSAQGTALTYSFEVRIGDFQIPSLARKSLSLDYQNLKVPVLVDHIPLDRSSEFSFRLDPYFELYKEFATRIKKGDAYRPFYENGDTSCLDTISVVYKGDAEVPGNTYDETINAALSDRPYEKEIYRWTFKNVIATQLKLGAFTRESGGPLKATVSFNFGYISEGADTIEYASSPRRSGAPGGVGIPATMEIM